MFKRRRTSYKDFSTKLRDVQVYDTRSSRIEPVSGICALCVDTASRLFAVGTFRGEIRIYDEQFKESILTTPKGTAVTLLQFARPRDLFKLLCIDSNNVLHVWNLDTYGIPPLQATHSLGESIYRISTCLNHSHALLATHSGDVVAYDLAKLQLSPYKIPHALGSYDDPPVPGPAIDVVIPPHHLNHVLLGYEGGVVLYDLVSRKALKIYTRISIGDDKQPALAMIALHPLGQHFAAGYEDGAIYLWDIHTSNAIWVGTTSGNFESAKRNPTGMEPIFKMEWSLIGEPNDSSKLWLTVLGGLPLANDNHNVISVLNFDIASFAGDTAESPGIAPGVCLYSIDYPAQDFAIIPPKSASADAHGRIIILSGEKNGDLALDAFEFPPRPDTFGAGASLEDTKAVELEFDIQLEESEERARDLATTLDDLKTNWSEEEECAASHVVSPRMPLPFPLLIGAASVVGVNMISVNKPEYLRLVRRLDESGTFTGKGDQYRILITHHRGMSVRFHDVSALSDGSDLSLHPIPLEHLTVRILDIPEIALRPDIRTLRIAAVTVASEALECVVQLSSGDVVVLGLGMRPRTVDVLDDEILDLSDVRDHGDVFCPRFILRAQNGGADVVCLSDIGFLAVGFKHGLLMVVDMRGPNVILRDAQDATSKHGETNVAKSLYWAVSAVGEDSTIALRLIALRNDGILSIYTLARSNGAWDVDKDRTIRDVHHSLSEPIMSIVLDAQEGTNFRATPASFASVVDSTTTGTPSKGDPNNPRCFWVAANRKEIRVGLNITGDRVSKINLSSQDTLNHTRLINAYGSSALVAFTQGGVKGIVYSLPLLEAVYSFQMPVALQPSSPFCCTSAGDTLQTYRSSEGGTILVFTSLFVHPTTHSSTSGNVNFRVHKYVKRSPPEGSHPRTDEASPQTWTSSVTTWIRSLAEETPATGDEVDLILAGSQPAEVTETPEQSAGLSSASNQQTKKSAGGTASMSNWGQGMYQQLTSAAAERGERLGQLDEHFQSLEAGSKDMVAQAKKLAERQAAKRWFW